MAYKQGVAMGASVALVIGAVFLLSLYAACSGVRCNAMAQSFGSPLWTGILALGTGIIGIFMSAKKSEKGCGGLFLSLSIICIFVTLACMGLTLYSSLYEVFYYIPTYYRPTYGTTTPATPTTAATPNPVTGFILWIIMMGVAFILSIITCVTSCQFCCCCQERLVIQPVIVYQGGANLPQNIILSNTNNVAPQQPVAPQVVFVNTGGTYPGSQLTQQTYPMQQMSVQLVGGAPYQPMGPQQPPPYAAQSSAPHPTYHAPTGPHQPCQQQYPQPTAPLLQNGSQTQASVSNRSGPATSASQNRSQPVHTTTVPSAPAPTFYQPLLIQSTERDLEIENTYFQTSGERQQTPEAPPITHHTFTQSPGRSPNTAAEDDGSYLPPSNPSATTQNPDDAIDDGAYEYIEEPSYDYCDPPVGREIHVGASEQYVNQRIADQRMAKKTK